eukprot:6923626-Prymnesium_polylepis.1
MVKSATSYAVGVPRARLWAHVPSVWARSTSRRRRQQAARTLDGPGVTRSRRDPSQLHTRHLS